MASQKVSDLIARNTVMVFSKSYVSLSLSLSRDLSLADDVDICCSTATARIACESRACSRPSTSRSMRSSWTRFPMAMPSKPSSPRSRASAPYRTSTSRARYEAELLLPRAFDARVPRSSHCSLRVPARSHAIVFDDSTLVVVTERSSCIRAVSCCHWSSKEGLLARWRHSRLVSRSLPSRYETRTRNTRSAVIVP